MARWAPVDAAAFLVHVATRAFGNAMAAIRVAHLTFGAETLTLILGVDLTGVEVLSFTALAALIAMLTGGAIIVAYALDHRALRRDNRSAVLAIGCAFLACWAIVLTKIAIQHTKVGWRNVFALSAVGIATLTVRAIITADIAFEDA